MGLPFVVLAATAAALATPLGGILASSVHRTRGRIREDVLRFVVALGGGLLLAAVVLVLVPEGLDGLPLAPALAWLLGGAVAVLAVDRAAARKGEHVSQVIGATLDSVPESLGLGAAFAAGGKVGPVLLALVALQNLPQGFNGFLEQRGPQRGAGRAVWTLTWTSLLGPVAAALGYLLLGRHPAFVHGIFLAAAGGILYILVQDVAPLAHKDGHWLPALGAVVGFAAGVACNGLVG